VRVAPSWTPGYGSQQPSYTGFPTGGHKPLAPSPTAAGYGVPQMPSYAGAKHVPSSPRSPKYGGVGAGGSISAPRSPKYGTMGAGGSIAAPRSPGPLGAASLEASFQSLAGLASASIGVARQGTAALAGAAAAQPMAGPAQRGSFSPGYSTKPGTGVVPTTRQAGSLQPAAPGNRHPNAPGPPVNCQGVAGYPAPAAPCHHHAGQQAYQRAGQPHLPDARQASWAQHCPQAGSVQQLPRLPNAGPPYTQRQPQRHQAIAASPSVPPGLQQQQQQQQQQQPQQLRAPPPGSFMPAGGLLPTKSPGLQPPFMQSVGASSPLAPPAPSPMGGFAPFKQQMPQRAPWGHQLRF